MKNIITIFCFFILIEPVMAVQNSSTEDTVTCDSPESRQFDFWIGDWDIQQKIIKKDGTWLEAKAHTSVILILNGCALEEHWEGDVKFFWSGMQNFEHMKGFSIRYYNPQKKHWNLRWLDNRNLNMGSGYTGNFINGKGEFFIESKTANGKRISRITFSDIKENSVHWDLAFSKDDGKTWTTIWIMEMKRHKE